MKWAIMIPAYFILAYGIRAVISWLVDGEPREHGSLDD